MAAEPPKMGRTMHHVHSMAWQSKAVCLSAIALILMLAYGNAAWVSFQFDDFNVIVNNPDIQSWTAWRTGLATGIRPLLKLSYAVSWWTGWGATGFVLFNLLVHVACSFLVWRLSLQILPRMLLAGGHAASPENMQAERAQLSLRPHVRLLFPGYFAGLSLKAMGLGSALLFLVHPIHTEAVSYISGRSSSLMALFYLAGLWIYGSSAAELVSRVRMAGVLLCFVLALAVKETAVTFPMALLAWELVAGRSLRYAMQRQWPVWALFCAGALVFLWSSAYQTHMQRSVDFNSLAGNIATQSLAFVYLCQQWVLPLWLNIDPDLLPQKDFAHVLPQALGLLLACALVPLWWRRRPWLAFALAWALLHLVALHLFLPRLDVANERQWYLASWPLCLALSVELFRAFPSNRDTVGEGSALSLAMPELPRPLRPPVLSYLSGPLLALVLALALLTHLRNREYASEIVLWRATLAQSPNKARVHNNLAYAYQLAGQTEAARQHYVRALQLDPRHVQARFNLRALEAKPK